MKRIITITCILALLTLSLPAQAQPHATDPGWWSTIQTWVTGWLGLSASSADSTSTDPTQADGTDTTSTPPPEDDGEGRGGIDPIGLTAEDTDG